MLISWVGPPVFKPPAPYRGLGVGGVGPQPVIVIYLHHPQPPAKYIGFSEISQITFCYEILRKNNIPPPPTTGQGYRILWEKSRTILSHFENKYIDNGSGIL
jgi:hypothetical protein